MKTGKRIYVTKEEARSIRDAIGDVQGNIEAWAGDEYIKSANMEALWNFEKKLARNGLLTEEPKP